MLSFTELTILRFLLKGETSLHRAIHLREGTGNVLCKGGNGHDLGFFGKVGPMRIGGLGRLFFPPILFSILWSGYILSTPMGTLNPYSSPMEMDRLLYKKKGVAPFFILFF